MLKIILNIFALLILSLAACMQSSQAPSHTVQIIGQMKDVMWKGELSGIITLDTIVNKNSLYGMGPVEYLAGEILIFDGRIYQSKVLTDTTMEVEETQRIKAPFFAYSNIPEWKETNLPDSIQTISELEMYLDSISKSSARPFMFKLNGSIETAKIHIVNLPKGARVSSPKEAHMGQVNYELKNELADIVGFFSTEHKTIFTHHDSFLHMHLITADRSKMGHLDDVLFQNGTMKLYLPAQ